MNKNVKVLTLGTGLLVFLSGVAFADTSATKGDVQRLEKQIESLRNQISELQATMRSHSANKGTSSMKGHQMGMGSQGSMGGNQGMGGGQQPMMDDDMDMPMGNQPMQQPQQQPQQMPQGGGMGHM